MDHDLLEPTKTEDTARTFRRRVFYIPGYDPIHPRRYRELYRKEGTEQATFGGYSIDLKPKTTKGPFGWHVTGQVAGVTADADIDVMVWSDIVRDSMSNSIPATYVRMLRTAWAYVGSGALFGLMRLRKGPTIAALYPIAFLMLQLVVAVLAGWAVGALVAALSHWALGLAAFAGVVVAGLRWFRSVDNRIYAYYLMQDYAFSALSGGANPPALEARIAEFRATIRAALEQDYDEVLVVGHSSGAHIGIAILSDLIRGGLPLHRPALAFLTLGQVVPMVSFLPGAHRLRADLRYLSARDEITWIDVTAPGDGCAFALCDPVAVSGVAPPNQRWPLIVSAAFSQTLSPQRWKALRWRFFRLHFQYLCAFDALKGKPGEYDYFQITAGPLILAERYRGRPPSASRITRAVNRHTSLTA